MKWTAGRLITGAFVAAMAFTATALTAHAQSKPLTLKMAHIYPPGNIWYDAAEDYAQRVEKATDGQVRISIAHSASTGDYPQAIEGLKIGTNDIVLQSIGTLDRYDPLPGIEAFPYVVRDAEQLEKIYNGPIGQEIADEIAKRTGFRIIGAGYRGARWLTSNRPVTSVDDIKGLKLRVPPLKMYRMTWDRLGASTVPMGVSELFTSLQQKVVDGQENPLEIVDSLKYYEVQGHATDTRHVIGAMTWIYSENRLQKLPEEIQAVLKEEGINAMNAASQRMLEMEEGLRTKLADAGMQIHEIDRDAMRAKLAGMEDAFPDLKPWIEKIRNADD